MDPIASMLHDIIMQEEDNLLHSLSPEEETEHLNDLLDYSREAIASDSNMAKLEASARSQMAHAHLIVQGRDVEALDFFSRLNAIKSLLPPDVTYSDYVTSIRSAQID
jgi:hypothetical protein